MEDTSPNTSVRVLGGLIAVAAVLQIIAVVVLQIPKVAELERAATLGPSRAIAVLGGFGIALLVAWLLRERTGLAVAVSVGILGASWLWGSTRGSLLALVLHGELILYHFTVLASVGLIASLGARWLGDAVLAKRALPAAVAAVAASIGTISLLAAHVMAGDEASAAVAKRLASVGAIAGLVGVALFCALSWSLARSRRDLIAVLLILVPMGLRIVMARADMFAGGPLTPLGASWVGVASVIVAVAIVILLRPTLPLWLTLSLALVCVAASSLGYFIWAHGYGRVEGGLDPLLRSLFGYALPYPQTIPHGMVAAFLLMVFCILLAVYGNLVSATERTRGIGLLLCACAGLGMSSPQLVLLMIAGLSLLIDAGRTLEPDEDEDPVLATATPAGIRIEVMAMLDALATRLGVDEPLLIEHVGMLRGDLEGVPIDLRVRLRDTTAKTELVLGHSLSSHALVVLRPDAGHGGARPAHLIGKTHRADGDLRALEVVGERVLDAVHGLPAALWELHDAGTRVEISGIATADAWEALIRAHVKLLRADS